MKVNEDLAWFKSIVNNDVIVKNLKKIKLVITDVDGCLTNGYVSFAEDGNELKGFSIQNGFGITIAQKAGLTIAFLTTPIFLYAKSTTSG